MLPTVGVLLVGHVTLDETPDGPRLGGSVAFSALTAQMLGLRAGIVTSAPDDMLPLLAPLANVPIQRVTSAQPTIFTNRYSAAGRQQTISARATPLTWEDIPHEWRSTALIHLAPVAGEIEPGILTRFPGAFVGLTPQGWMRGWDDVGRVRFQGWSLPHSLTQYASAVVFSIEDIQGDEALAQRIAHQCKVIVVTRGARGCTLFANGKPHTIPAARVDEIDATGAGDIFAMAFFARLKATHSPLAACRFALSLASHSVTRTGLDSIPTKQEVDNALHTA
jgi:sugar/nucleoside kinase (ribokinase family)